MAQIHVVGLNAGRFENLGGSNDSGGLVVQPAGATAPALELRHAGSGSGLTIALTGSGYGLTVTGGNVGFGTATPGYQVEIASTLKVGTYADFPGIANPTAPAAGTVRFHATTTNGLTRFEQDNEAATNLVLGRDNVVIAKNTSGSIIAAGTPVYVTGATGNVPNIGLAKADVIATLPAIGMTLDSIGINAFGQVMGTGIITGINTSAYAVGDLLYVSATTAGALTNTRPVSPNLVQRLATVLVSGVGNGALQVVTAPFVGGLESGTTGSFTVAGALTVNGNTQLGDAGTDTTTVTGALAIAQTGSGDGLSVAKSVTAAGTGLSVGMASTCTGAGIVVSQLGNAHGIYVSKSGAPNTSGSGISILMDATSDGYGLEVTAGNWDGVHVTSAVGSVGVGRSLLWVESSGNAGDAATIRAIGGTGSALYVSASASTGITCSAGTGLAASLSRSSTGGNSVNITHAGTAAGDNALYVAPGAVTAGHGISVNCPSMNGGHGIYISYAGGAGSAISISQGATTGPAIAVSNSATSGPLLNLTAASGANTSYGATISVAGSGTALIAAVTGSGTGRVAEFNAPSNKSLRVLNNGTLEIDGGASPVGRAFHRVVGASRMISGILAAVVSSTHGATVSGAYLGAYGALDGALLIPLELPDGSALYGFSIYVSIGNTGFNTSTAGVYLARVTGGASSTQEYFDDTTNTWGAGTEYTQVRSGAPAFFTAGPTGAAGLTNPQTLDRANYDYYLRVRFTSSLGAYQDGTIRGRCYHADLWGHWLKLSPGP